MKALRIAHLLIYAALSLIVAGALTSWLTAREQTLILYPGRPETHMSMQIELHDFEIIPGRDYVSHFTVNGKPVRASLNRPARTDGVEFCQLSYIADGGSVIAMRRDLAGTLMVFGGYALFAVGGLIAAARRRPAAADALFAATLTAAGIYGMVGARTNPEPILQTAWMPVHVGLAMAAYSSLLIVAILAAVGRTDRARRLLPAAVWLLGLAIIVGSVWAERSWGRYWGWDPKETLALITMALYLVPLHLKRAPRWLYIVPLAAVALTWFGVGLLSTSSLHSYN